MRGAILILLTCLPAVGGAVNKCIDQAGKTTYQADPCPAAAKQSAVQGTQPASNPASAKPDRTSGDQSAGDRLMLADAIMAEREELAQEMVKVKLLVAKRVAEGQAEGQACFERHRSSLRDPRSAYVVGASVFEDRWERFAYVDVSARNGLGGAARIGFICTIEARAKPETKGR